MGVCLYVIVLSQENGVERCGRGGNWHTISGERGRVGVPVLPKNHNQKECVMGRGQGDRKQLSNCKIHDWKPLMIEIYI